MSSNILSILFEKDGFSFCSFKDQKIIATDFTPYEVNSEVAIELVLEHKIKDNLYLKQEYDQVYAQVLGEQFCIVPDEYYQQEKDNELWISFNTELYENDKVVNEKLVNTDAHFLYSYPIEIEQMLSKFYPKYEISSASSAFLNAISTDNETPEVFVNIHHRSVEILCLKNQKLLFYNVFSVQSENDIIYYILNVYKQLSLDTNQDKLYFFGNEENWEGLIKKLLNFVRHVIPGVNDATELQYYTHYLKLL
ncbi:DUF3822 family protein [Ornithobacterium rhinotracheale]|uniref:DUF3822 family protein n=1 Tax=Ornithobacterium rhinotracheale TaxID=28251 RepID=UPI003FA4963E